MLRRTLLTAAAIFIAAAAALDLPAAASGDPVAFINNLGNQLQVAMRNTSREQRLTAFHGLFREVFDVPGLGRFVLGRFWRMFTPPEQQEYLRLFEDYVVLTYSDRLSEYIGDGDVIRAIGSRLDPDGVFVSSEIVHTGSWREQAPTMQPIMVGWRLRAHDGTYKIGDVIIGGISMAANGRSTLEGVVERNGGRAQAILAVMRQQTVSAAYGSSTSSLASPPSAGR